MMLIEMLIIMSNFINTFINISINIWGVWGDESTGRASPRKKALPCASGACYARVARNSAEC